MRDSTSAAIVQVSHLSKQVHSPGGVLTILDDVSLTIPHASTVAIVGASGSGKSTLLGLMAGLDLPSQGSVQLDGVDLTALDEDGRASARAGRVGFVFQSFQLLPGLTALENVMLPLELAHAKRPEQRAREVLEGVGLGSRARHYPNQLSGGEQQRVAIARAIAKQPRVLLCDEPTGALDSKTGIVVLEALSSANRRLDTTTLVITHNAGIAEMADRVLIMADGAIKETRVNAQPLKPSELSW